MEPDSLKPLDGCIHVQYLEKRNLINKYGKPIFPIGPVTADIQATILPVLAVLLVCNSYQRNFLKRSKQLHGKCKSRKSITNPIAANCSKDTRNQ